MHYCRSLWRPLMKYNSLRFCGSATQANVSWSTKVTYFSPDSCPFFSPHVLTVVSENLSSSNLPWILLDYTFSSLLKRNIWIFKSGDWNLYSLPGYESSKYFSCNFKKKEIQTRILSNFKKLQKKGFWKFITGKWIKIPITGSENSKISLVYSTGLDRASCNVP